MNKITALNIVCTRPKELDRQSLRELIIELDRAGYNRVMLNEAWKDVKNEDIAADIISYIRRAALGSSLVSHEERIKNAINKIRVMKSWNKVQEKWLDRIELQLIKETVIREEDLDASPFSDAGGFQRLDRIFNNDLQNILTTINDNLYSDAG